MKIGYVRVSTLEQNEARQLKMMQEQNVEKVFIDKMSGKNTQRPALQEMLDFIRAGDILIVESYSRLGRSTLDLLTIIDQLNNKGVQFISLKENIDTTSPSGKLMMSIFSSLAEYEREIIKLRQREGIEIRKLKGLYRGRVPIKVDEKEFKEMVSKVDSGSITAREAMNRLNLKPNTFYRRRKELSNK